MKIIQEHLLLGEILIADQIVSSSDLDKALLMQNQLEEKLGNILIRIGALSEDNLLASLSKQLNLPVLNYQNFPVQHKEVSQFLDKYNIDIEWMSEHQTVIWKSESSTICCASSDPLNISVNEYFETLFPEEQLYWHIAFTHDVERFIEDLLNVNNDIATNNVTHLREMAEEAPVIEFVNNLIAKAFERRASDIHIEPEELNIQIRARIDGILYNLYTLSKERFNAIASRIKLISGMDIAEYRIPQDGQIETRVSGVDIDIRVSSLPGVYGESIVMRLLPKENHRLTLEIMGLSPENLRLIKSWVNEPHGIILVTGPTGSGKSTSLYALLNSINNNQRKIITVEDPVEYRLPGITQVQVKEDIDYTFATALRAILRQDPDVIMVGEIRDAVTANISIQASLTGHLVLSTLHTNDAASAFTRLIDMGVEPFLVATPIRAVMAQRLVRKLCLKCAIPIPPPIELLAGKPKFKESNWMQAVGCDHCQDTGYNGRIAIHEIITVTPEIKQAIIERENIDNLHTLLVKQGFISLKQDGLMKASQGLTTTDEVFRATTN